MLQLYWKNATDRAVGRPNGVSRADLERLRPRITQAHKVVSGQCKSGQLGYATLPRHAQYPAMVKRLVEKYSPDTTDFVVLGIGGSSLGNIALQSALNPATYNLLSDNRRGGPRLFVLDNVDPSLVNDTLKYLGRRMKTTVFNVISKSGETAETASQFMIVREILRNKIGHHFSKHIVATTDMEKGTLRDIALKDGYDMLPVPGDVGGRFSVLSAVGLFSAAMCGIDIDALLAGAAAMKDRLEADFDDFRDNPACMLAAIKYLMAVEKGKPMHVMMPYSNRLYMLADWYRQLWAESLGKQFDRDGKEIFAGPTPIKALGATDQHSQVQLYREGPNDKLTVFLEVAKHSVNLRIPDIFEDIPGLTYLRKQRLEKLINAEKKATEFAMAASKRPSVTLTFNSITPQSIGEFIYFYEFVTSLSGELYNINVYDQPAVELGKKATFALMGRKGYEDLEKKIKPFRRTDRRFLA